MDEIKTKQQVVERIKQAEKILITVSNSPSVDALSAALGLALLLDNQGKYVTAIFSGETPPAIAFLQPEKTFDDTTDSLRDFIIALNKEKADHLRYKVEGDAVKIFITPYKTTISESDLEFSQGDYNVELVIALGVGNQDHLDAALAAHGQILHDADIITVTAGDQTSDLGGIDWHEVQASSLSEMVAGLAEALKDDKKKSLLDASIATALLTGIVAETDRFSNEHTTSKVMTVAATLMAAGADQQLIATELQRADAIDSDSTDADASDDEGASPEEGNPDDETSGADGSTDAQNGELSIKKDGLTIKHDETLADLDKRVRGEEKAKEKIEEEIEALEEDAKDMAKKYPLVDDSKPKTKSTKAPAKKEEPAPEAVAPVRASAAYALEDDVAEPLLGGTLSATTEQAADDARRALEDDKNKTILSHSYLGGNPAVNENSNTADGHALVGFPGTPEVAPGSVGVNSVPAPDEVHSAYAFDDSAESPAAQAEATSEAPVTPSPAVGGERVIQPLSPTPADLGLPLPPPLPDFSSVGAVAPPPAIPLPPSQPPEILGDILAPEAPVAPSAAPSVPQAPSTPPVSQTDDPAQFQIPGQPS